MDLKQISGYLAQKKIKSMYLGQDLIYQDSKPQGLYFMEYKANTTTRVIVPIKYSVTTELKFLKLGGE